MTLDEVLKEAAQQSAFTVHLLSDRPPVFNLAGNLAKSDALPDALTSQQIADLVLPYLLDAARADFASGKIHWAEAVSAPDAPQGFYLCVFRSQKQISALVRLLLPDVPTIAQIGGDSAPLLEKITEAQHGLVVISGPYASGKGTSAFSLLNAIADARAVRLFTVESGIAYRLNKPYATQWVVGQDIESYPEAARRIAKCDAGVVFFADLPNAETVRAALALADTGHLVIANFAAESVGDALQNVIAAFDGNAPLQKTLARTLVCVVNQRLLRRTDKPGRVALYEVLWVDAGGVRDAIRANRLSDLEALMEADENCQTHESALAALQKSGVV